MVLKKKTTKKAAPKKARKPKEKLFLITFLNIDDGKSDSRIVQAEDKEKAEAKLIFHLDNNEGTQVTDLETHELIT